MTDDITLPAARKALHALLTETNEEIARLQTEGRAIGKAIAALHLHEQELARLPPPRTKPPQPSVTGNGRSKAQYVTRQDQLHEIIRKSGKIGLSTESAVDSLIETVETTESSARQMLYLLANKGLIKRSQVDGLWRSIR
jgi:hypothetical protein